MVIEPDNPNPVSIFDVGKKINKKVYQYRITIYYIFSSPSFEIVLRNTDGELRYFYASGNETSLEEPFQISKKGDIETLMLRLKTNDLLQTAMQSRPNSKWSVYVVTNIRWMVTRTNYILGSNRKLPDYIRKKRSIIALDNRSDNGALIEDNLCAFRCLAYHRTKKRRKRQTIQYCREYFRERLCKRTNFKGLF